MAKPEFHDNTWVITALAGYRWTPVQTCSLHLTAQAPRSNTWWQLKELQSAQAGGTHPTGMLSWLYLNLTAAHLQGSGSNLKYIVC